MGLSQAEIDKVDQSLILRTVNLGNGHKWALEESQYYACRAICATHMGIGGTKLADLDDDEGFKTNAMTTALQAQQMGLNPKVIISKRMRDKEDYSGMSKLRNRKKAKQVYQPVYIEEKQEAEVEYNKNAYEVYKAMFSNASRVRITGEQYKKLIGKIFETPGGIKFTSEEIITQGLASMTMADGDDSDGETVAEDQLTAEQLAQLQAQQQDLNNRGNVEKMGILGAKLASVPGKIGNFLVGGLKKLNDHVFVPGSSGRPIIFLSMIFMLWHGSQKLLEYQGYMGTPDGGASESYYSWLTRGFWGNVARVPINTNVFDASGLSEQYTMFVESFWDKTSELGKVWNLVADSEYTQLRKFMNTAGYKDGNLGTLTETGVTDVNTMMRWAMKQNEDGLAATHFRSIAEQSNKDPEKMMQFFKDARKQLKKLQEAGELQARATIGEGSVIVRGGKIENPFKKTLDAFRDAQKDEEGSGGTAKDAQFAMENQRQLSWKVLITSLAFSLLRTALSVSGVSEAVRAGLKNKMIDWMRSFGLAADMRVFGVLKKQFNILVAANKKIKAYQYFDATIAITFTVTAYSLYNTVRAFGSMYDTWHRDNAGRRILKSYSFLSNLTLLCSSMYMIYGLLTVGPAYILDTGITPMYVATRYGYTVKCLWLEEAAMWLAGYRDMTGSQITFQQGLALTCSGILMTYASNAETPFGFTLGHVMQVAMFTAMSLQTYQTFSPIVEERVLKPVSAVFKRAYRTGLGMKPEGTVNGGFGLVDGFGSLLTNMILKVDPDYKPAAYVDLTNQNPTQSQFLGAMAGQQAGQQAGNGATPPSGPFGPGTPVDPSQETADQRIARQTQQARQDMDAVFGLNQTPVQQAPAQQAPLNQRDQMFSDQAERLRQAREGEWPTGPTLFRTVADNTSRRAELLKRNMEAALSNQNPSKNPLLNQMFGNSTQQTMTPQQYQQAQMQQNPMNSDAQRGGRTAKERYAALQQRLAEIQNELST